MVLLRPLAPSVHIGTKESNRGQVILLSHGQLDHPVQIGMCDLGMTISSSESERNPSFACVSMLYALLRCCCLNQDLHSLLWSHSKKDADISHQGATKITENREKTKQKPPQNRIKSSQQKYCTAGCLFSKSLLWIIRAERVGVSSARKNKNAYYQVFSISF